MRPRVVAYIPRLKCTVFGLVTQAWFCGRTMVHPKMDAPHDFAIIPTTAKALWIGFGDFYGHAKPCFYCDNV
jgi:hypothetical protein